MRLEYYNDVQRFLGLIQYLAHFLPDISAYTGPLARMTMNGTSFYLKPIHEKCHYRIHEQETLAILETLLKWEDKLLGYCIHVVTDHKALELFKMQSHLLSRQTRWMDYLARFDFDIRYIKGTLNKVVDALTWYYEHDYWTEVLEIQDYINADVRLDPEHDDLPWECLFKVEEGIIEVRVRRANSVKVHTELRALTECIQERDTIVAEMATGQEQDGEPSTGGPVEEDPTVFES